MLEGLYSFLEIIEQHFLKCLPVGHHRDSVGLDFLHGPQLEQGQNELRVEFVVGSDPGYFFEARYIGALDLAHHDLGLLQSDAKWPIVIHLTH